MKAVRHYSRISQSQVPALLTFLCVCLALNACSRLQHAAQRNAAEADSTTFDVKWADNTIILDAETVKRQMQSADAKTGRYVIAPSAPAELRNARVGAVLLLSDTALRRVTNVSTENGGVVLETVPAALNEAIKDGQINWRRVVLFNPPATQQSRNAGAPSDPRGNAPDFVAAAFRADSTGALRQPFAPGASLALAGGGLEREYATNFEGKLKGFDVSMKLTPKSDKLEIELEVKKAIANGEGFKLTAKGWISGFISEGSIRYEGGRLREFQYLQRNLRGEMKLGVTGVRLGTDEVAFAIPVKIPIPIQIGPLPATLNIMATLSIVPQLFGESSSRGDFTVSYSADQGIKLGDGGQTPLGAVTNPQLDISNGNTAGFQPVGLGVTVEFPRVEVAIMGESVVPYLSVDTRTYGYYSPMVKICQESGLKIKSEVGYKLKFLGAQEWSGSKELWSKETKASGGQCQ